MFVDTVTFTVSSGKGGAGCASFHREKFVVKGGPDGGDGGKGGDVYFLVDNNTDTLSWYKGKRHLKAKNGKDGTSKRRTGKSGEDLTLIVPPGTQVFNADTDELILDLTTNGQKELLLKGGKGGLGNFHFKSSRNQKPTYAQPGMPGEKLNIRLELKLIASVGLVGFPNVGKSTLISTVSNASAAIANYEFTTLTPKLGVVEVGEYDSFVMADIPGIIEGASLGKGLGIEFLKHIERTKILLFMIDLSNYRTPINQYKELKKELQNFSNELSKKKFAIALTKTDVFDKESLKEIMKKFFTDINIKPNKIDKYDISDELDYFVNDDFNSNEPLFVLPLSSATQLNINPLKYLLNDIIKEDEKNSN